MKRSLGGLSITLVLLLGVVAEASLNCRVRLTDEKKSPWALAQGTELVNEFSWLKKPLNESLASLGVIKRIRLKRLLKAYNPEVDFLLIKNSQDFLDTLIHIFDDNRPNSNSMEAKRAELTKIAILQLSSRDLTQDVLDVSTKTPSLRLRLKRFISRLNAHPIMSLFGFPPQIPRWRDPLLAEDVLSSLILRRWEGDINQLEQRVLVGSQMRRSYNKVKTFVNIVITSVSALLMFHSVSEASTAFEVTVNHALVEYQSDVSRELERAQVSLNELSQHAQQLDNNPESFILNLLVEEFQKNYGAKPSEVQLEQLTQLTHRLILERQVSLY